MEISLNWWGTAAFKLVCDGTTILLDPYISRNPQSEPRLNVKLADTTDADYIFLSHGHFDHVADVPNILKRNQKAKVYGPKPIIDNLKKLGCNPNQVKPVAPGRHQLQANVSVSTLNSKHVHFDTPLVLRTLGRALKNNSTRRYLQPSLLYRYPCGQTQAYLFHFKNFKVLFLGSAGPTQKMLEGWVSKFGQVDCLLLPLQGNTDICQIGAKITEVLKPKIVVPHHHDNFYPPISQRIDIEPFRELVARQENPPQILELRLEEGVRWFSSDVEATQEKAKQKKSTHIEKSEKTVSP